jgi:hypothetical protein
MSESSRAWKALAAVALIAAAGAVVVSLIALNKPKPRAPVNRVGAAQLASLGGEVQALKTELATLHTAVAKGDATLAKLTTCLPELTGQINGLTVETGNVSIGERTFLTNAYLKYGKALSSYCQATLEAK